MHNSALIRRLPAIAALFALAMPAAAQPRLDYRFAAPPALVDALKRAPREERGAIAEAMVTRRAEMLPALRDAARSGDAADRIIACSMIAELRDRDGVDAVVAASADPEVLVRRRAATVLRLLADRRALPRLRQLVRNDGDLGVVKTAIAALGRIGAARDIPLIAPFLTHADEGVRVVAAGALAMLGDQRGLDLVLQATASADPGVQKSATYALGFFTAPAAAARLQAILDDPQGAWKSYALIAQAEQRLAAQSPVEQVATLDAAASGRSRTLAEWAVDRLTDIGTADAAAVLRKISGRTTSAGRLAERRARILEAQP